MRRALAGDAGRGGAIQQRGSYGGVGGVGRETSVLAPINGSITEPTDLGSGGGQQVIGADVRLGGPGGGAVRLTVGGVLLVEGVLAADGQSPGLGEEVLGSLWIACDQVSGSGRISADGATTGPDNGGGGGGRIAVYCRAKDHTGLLTAVGGGGYAFGSAGTIYTRFDGSPKGLLLIQNRDNGASRVSATEFSGHTILDMNVEIGAFGWVSHPPETPLHLEVRGNLHIIDGGRIDVSGRGYAAGTGPGTPGAAVRFNSGGSYGGVGGVGRETSVLAPINGSITEPTDLGSGGGQQVIGADVRLGGPGGGAVRLTVGGVLLVEGVLAADGQSPGFGGGGSGGSLWIACDQVSGSGRISADGATTGPDNGGGGGGRIAVYCRAKDHTGLLTAVGGGGYAFGSAGTIYTRFDGSPKGLLLIQNRDNGASRVSATEFSGHTILDMNVEIGAFGWVSHPPETPLHLEVRGNLHIIDGGRIDVSGRGYAAGTGPGTPNVAVRNSSGGSYGGVGGVGRSTSVLAPIYGSITEPTDLGSGGGQQVIGAEVGWGGPGGGAVRLTVGGVLLVEGVLAADGQSPGFGGGGSGGSLWIACDQLSGSGRISADGGTTGADNGGGGGGRIAIYATCSIESLEVHAAGGTGWESGQDGTVVLIEENTEPPIAQNDTLGGLAEHALDIHPQKLLKNDVDPEGGSLTLGLPGGTSAQGGTVNLVNGRIHYEPPAGYDGPDSFEYTASDQCGLTDTATVTINVRTRNQMAANLVSITPGPDGCQVRMVGVPGRTYRVEVSGDLLTWIPLPGGADFTAGANGMFEFLDTGAAEGSCHFYRLTLAE
ncbi:MAG: cadherin-like domain-containing protein [Verrucomicrobiales bacterium]|nr:cadherin-like domain-containing protein [Verrucomicrobiales bacterium]